MIYFFKNWRTKTNKENFDLGYKIFMIGGGRKHFIKELLEPTGSFVEGLLE